MQNKWKKTFCQYCSFNNHPLTRQTTTFVETKDTVWHLDAPIAGARGCSKDKDFFRETERERERLFPNCEGSMLNGRPFKDADKHCANDENTRKFTAFSGPLFLRISRFFKWILNDPKSPQSIEFTRYPGS